MTLILLPIKWANGIMAKSFTILDARKIKERDREIERWRECEKERERKKEREGGTRTIRQLQQQLQWPAFTFGNNKQL